jgi:hypothetical protein
MALNPGKCGVELQPNEKICIKAGLPKCEFIRTVCSPLHLDSTQDGFEAPPFPGTPGHAHACSTLFADTCGQVVEDPVCFIEY